MCFGSRKSKIAELEHYEKSLVAKSIGQSAKVKHSNENIAENTSADWRQETPIKKLSDAIIYDYSITRENSINVRNNSEESAAVPLYEFNYDVTGNV
jgi:rRNA maturation endonuclease Nob1